MAAEELENDLQEQACAVHEDDKLLAIIADLQKKGADLARIEEQMQEVLRNSARLINGTLGVFEAILREQERVKFALREQGGQLQKRLSIYSEETTSHLHELEDRLRQEREQEKKQRQEADEQVIRVVQDKIQRTHKRTKADLASVKAMVAVFGGACIALIILFKFFL